MRPKLLLVLFGSILGIEQGKLELELVREHIARVPKSLYKDSQVKLNLNLTCAGADKTKGSVVVKVVMRSTTCTAEYINLPKETINWYFQHPSMKFKEGGNGQWFSYEETVDCGHNHLSPDPATSKWHQIKALSPDPTDELNAKLDAEEKAVAEKEDAKEEAKSRRRRSSEMSDTHLVTTTPLDAQYLLMLTVDFKDTESVAKLQIEFKGPLGYLSAMEYPLLTFFMIMTIVYGVFGLIWMVFSVMNYKELIRIQFWIGGVIFLGMLEKAVFYSEYSAVNHTGLSLTGAHKFAQAVSALKRSLARMLVIIVSLGFGIIKPRLGPMLHRIVGVGALYFILATVDAFVHVDTATHDVDNKTLLFTQIPLAILDSIICWWIFVSLMATMKTLRLRRNVMKLAIYRHFANIVVFMVVASVIFILWDIQTHRTGACIEIWDEVWLNQAFWHLLFSIILFSIMILWRPSAMSKRYEYSPLVDDVDSEDEEDAEAKTKSNMAKNVKKRGGDGGGNSAPVDQDEKMEDDLKWIDENIPETLAEGSAALIDSDDEVMNTKYEMSKME
jgi:hypothetical protein